MGSTGFIKRFFENKIEEFLIKDQKAIYRRYCFYLWVVCMTEEKIDAKKAGICAKEYLKDIQGISPLNFTIEEVDMVEGGKYWKIVCSYLENYLTSSKTYKEFKIDSSTGKVVSMKSK